MNTFSRFDQIRDCQRISFNLKTQGVSKVLPLSQGILSDIGGLGGRGLDPGGRRLDDQVAESLVGDRLPCTDVGVRGDSFREGA